MLTRLRDAYRRWRYRRACDTVRQELYRWSGGNPLFLELTDEELQLGVETIVAVMHKAGMNFEEAAAAIARVNRIMLTYGQTAGIG